MYILANGHLLTHDEGQPWFDKGAVVFSDSHIIEAGQEQEMRKKYPSATLIDAEGGLIMPALVNMHEHTYSAMARGLSLPGFAPQSFSALLEGLWWRLDATLNAEDIYYSALLTFIDCVKNGVTTVFDHHASYNVINGSLSLIAEAAKQSGIRACLCFEVSDRGGYKKAAEAVAENVRFIERCHKEKNPMLKGLMGLHASFTVSNSTLAACRDAIINGTGFHIHVAEGPEDQRHCLNKYEVRVIERLRHEEILGPHSIAVHGIDIDEEEIALLAETKTALIHNPQSNMGNAVGCAPLAAMEAAGVKLGLGTDGYTHDMLESMKAAQLLQKHHLRDSNAGFDIATGLLFRKNPRLASNHFSTELGQIKANAAADIIVVDYCPFTPLDEKNASGHMVFGVTGQQVRTVVAAGQLIMAKGKFTDLDEEKIYAEAQEVAQKLWKRI